MAYTTQATSVKTKTNLNDTIATSTIQSISQGNLVKNVSLTEIKNAINKLSTYIQKVDNCGNCYNITLCQTVTTSTKATTSTKTTTYYNYYSDDSDGGGD